VHPGLPPPNPTQIQSLIQFARNSGESWMAAHSPLHRHRTPTLKIRQIICVLYATYALVSKCHSASEASYTTRDSTIHEDKLRLDTRVSEDIGVARGCTSTHRTRSAPPGRASVNFWDIFSVFAGRVRFGGLFSSFRPSFEGDD